MNIKRIIKLQSQLKHPLLIKKPENLFYLTGRFFMHGYLLVKKYDVVFFGEGLEKPPGVKEVDRLKNISKYLKARSVLEIEDEFTFAEYKYIKHKTRNLKLRAVKSLVDYLRQIKEPSEISRIRRSMKIVKRVFGIVKRELARKIWTEIQLADFIKKLGLKLGADDVSFPVIVASGLHAAEPHHRPTKKRLKTGESIILDFGFKYRGYCSDFSRTLFLKSVPQKLEKAYHQVEMAHNVCMKTVRSGIRTKFLYQKAVEILDKAHLAKYFVHNLGHGLGLEIHELPNLSLQSKEVLQKDMVVTIEPGIYIEKIGGVRIENVVVVAPKGGRPLSGIPTNLKDMII